MTLIGLDISVTSPALVAWDREKRAWGAIHFIAPNAEVFARKGGWKMPRDVNALMHKTEIFRMFRLDWLRTNICGAIAEIRPEVVAIEDYAVGGQGMDFYMPELVGAVKNWLFRNGIPFRTYAPAYMKALLAGRSDARKEEMVAAAFEKGWLREPWEYGGNPKSSTATGDVVDAMAVVRLLDLELTCRADRKYLDTLPANVRRFLLRVSDHDGNTLLTRPFTHKDNMALAMRPKTKKGKAA